MRKWIVAGNWKMNNNIGEAVALARGIREGLPKIKDGEVVLAPPFTALSSVAAVVAGSSLKLAAQNSHHEDQGAFTGEVSPAMLADIGCQYVIIGHSERRKYFFESDESINLKVKKVLSSGLSPIVCVGETEEERKQGITSFVVGRQVKKAFYGIGEIERIVIAYEPVWAIGTGKVATSKEAQEVHQFIRSILRELYGDKSSPASILYGGSVTKDNIGDLISQPDIDGALVGGASLRIDGFLDIVRTISEKKSSSSISKIPCPKY